MAPLRSSPAHLLTSALAPPTPSCYSPHMPVMQDISTGCVFHYTHMAGSPFFPGFTQMLPQGGPPCRPY